MPVRKHWTEVEWPDGVPAPADEKPLVSDCVYFNYKFNRQSSPDVAPREWACIFGEHRIPALEKRFQLDKER